jgi:hypothetical protein
MMTPYRKQIDRFSWIRSKFKDFYRSLLPTTRWKKGPLFPVKIVYPKDDGIDR